MIPTQRLALLGTIERPLTPRPGCLLCLEDAEKGLCATTGQSCRTSSDPIQHDLQTELGLHDATKERLHQVSSLKVVTDVLENLKARNASEVTRTGSLDTKAGQILAVAGFAVTIATSFGGNFLVANADKFSAPRRLAVTLVLTITVGAALRAAILAVDALKARTFSDPQPAAMIHETVLKNGETFTTAGYEDDALAIYRRFMCQHYARIIHVNHHANNDKAESLSSSQSAFAWFIGCLGVLTLVLAAVAPVSSTGEQQPAKPEAPAAPSGGRAAGTAP